MPHPHPKNRASTAESERHGNPGDVPHPHRAAERQEHLLGTAARQGAQCAERVQQIKCAKARGEHRACR